MKNNGRGTIELFRYSLKTLRRTLGGFVILFVIGTVGAYLLTTSVLLYKCSGDVIKASSLPYSGYYIVAEFSAAYAFRDYLVRIDYIVQFCDASGRNKCECKSFSLA